MGGNFRKKLENSGVQPDGGNLFSFLDQPADPISLQWPLWKQSLCNFNPQSMLCKQVRRGCFHPQQSTAVLVMAGSVNLQPHSVEVCPKLNLSLNRTIEQWTL